MVLEQDHRRLNRVVEGKIAIDAEISDFHDNKRMLDFVVVAGLDPIDPDLFGKAWQDQAVKNVQEVFKLLMGKTMDIVYVKNATARHKDAIVTYNVQMRTIAESKEIRDKFGSYFLGGKSKLPDALKRYSIRNRVTPNTKVRRSILQVIGCRYQTSNPGSKVQVVGYDPRPLIKITPPPSASDRRIRTYNFIDAVTTLPCSFSHAEIEPIVRRVNSKLLGKVRSTFVILSDDQLRKHLAKYSKSSKGPRSTSVPTVAEVVPEGDPVDEVDEANVDQVSVVSVGSNPGTAPAPPSAPSGSRGRSTGSGSRNPKRGATDSPDSNPAKK